LIIISGSALARIRRGSITGRQNLTGVPDAIKNPQGRGKI